MPRSAMPIDRPQWPSDAESTRSRVWWPASLAALGALVAIALAYIGLTGDESSTRLSAGIGGYVVGALFVAILANVQRAWDIRAEGLRYRGVLQRQAPSVAKLSMWVGLVAGLVAAFTLATELAR